MIYLTSKKFESLNFMFVEKFFLNKNVIVIFIIVKQLWL